MAYSTDGTTWQSMIYNALGQRVANIYPDGTYTRTLSYPRDISGHRTEAFEDNPGVWAGADVWWGRIAGQRLEMGGSTSWLDHTDAVGTMTMQTDQTGAVEGDATYGPWGNRSSATAAGAEAVSVSVL